ncbi:hypothetical protein N9V68_00835 [Octadecabacter sp.]|nr:hypothetical protein [Octadecabacter sp.]
MKRSKIATGAMAAVTVVAMAIPSTSSASTGGDIAAGLVGGLALNAIVQNADYGYHDSGYGYQHAYHRDYYGHHHRHHDYRGHGHHHGHHH